MNTRNELKLNMTGLSMSRIIKKNGNVTIINKINCNLQRQRVKKTFLL